jgi:hypothetical protein
MESDGWRRRKRKAPSDAVEEFAEARVLDAESGQKKHVKTFERKNVAATSESAAASDVKRRKLLDETQVKQAECILLSCSYLVLILCWSSQIGPKLTRSSATSSFAPLCVIATCTLRLRMLPAVR